MKTTSSVATFNCPACPEESLGAITPNCLGKQSSLLFHQRWLMSLVATAGACRHHSKSTPAAGDWGRLRQHQACLGALSTVLLLLVAMPNVSLAQTRTWANANAGNLLTNSNWSPSGAPNAPGATAIFNANPTSGDFTLNGSMTLGTLTYNNANFNVIGGSGTLTFQTSSGNALFHTTSNSRSLGPHMSNLVLASTTEFRIEGNQYVDTSSTISGGGGLTKTGGNGLALYNNNSSYTGLNTISGGWLSGHKIANSGSNSSFGRGNFIISNNAELEYGGSSASTNRTISLGSGGGRIWVVSPSTVLNWTGVISGAGGLTKGGSGTLRLSASNTYGGATNISGPLQLGAAERLPNGTAVTVNGGATFNLNNFNETIGSLEGTGGVSLGSGNLTTGGNNSSTTFNGVISGSGSVTKAGNGTLTLWGNGNNYTGNTIVSQGALRLRHANALGSTVGYTEVLGAGASSTGRLELAGEIAYAAEPLRLRGRSGGDAHLVNVSGNNTWRGPISLLSDASYYYIDSQAGQLTLDSTATISQGTAAGNRFIHFRGAGNGVLGGSILEGTNASYHLTKSGSGTWTTNTLQPYSGRTLVEEGTFRIDAGGHVSNTAAVVVGASGSGNLLLQNGGQLTVVGDGSTISAGGSVGGVDLFNGTSYIGLNDGSHGEATVTGSGSLWSSSSHLILGGSSLDTATTGTALLKVSDGGKVVVGGALKLHEGGTLAGNGGTVQGNVLNNGTVAPGNSAGLLTIDGDYTQEVSGKLNIDLGGLAAGTQYDQLAVTGNASLNGELNVQLINGFELGQNETFHIVTVGDTLSGTFAGLGDGALVNTLGGVDLFISYHSGGVSLYTVPEPSSFLLLGLGVVAGIARRSRRR